MQAVTEKDHCNDAVIGHAYFESAHQKQKMCDIVVLESLEGENVAEDLHYSGKWCFSRCQVLSALNTGIWGFGN